MHYMVVAPTSSWLAVVQVLGPAGACLAACSLQLLMCQPLNRFDRSQVPSTGLELAQEALQLLGTMPSTAQSSVCCS